MSSCSRTKQTTRIEDQFTVTSSAGIRKREKKVADIVVRDLKRTKPGVWGWIQDREVWSSEEEANIRSGHFWMSKIGTFPGSMTCVERKFEFQDRKCKWEESRAPGTPTGTVTSSLNRGSIGLLMMCQDSRFRSGTPQRVLTTQTLR